MSEPARFADEVLGTLTVGYALDDAVAAGARRGDAVRGQPGRPARASRPAAFAARNARRSSAARRRRCGRRAIRPVGRAPHASAAIDTSRGRFRCSTHQARSTRARSAHPAAGLAADAAVRRRLRAAVLRGRRWSSSAWRSPAALMFSRRISRPLRDIAAAARTSPPATCPGSAGQRQRRSDDVARGVQRHERQPACRARAPGARRHPRHLTQLPNRALFMERLERAMTRRARHPGLHLRRAVHRPRSLQARQRQPRPRRRRPAAARVARAAGAARCGATTPCRGRPRRRAGPRRPNTLARFGGDEFTILLDDIREPDRRRARRRAHPAGGRRAASRSTATRCSSPPASASRSARRCHAPGEDVLRDADIAMYRAKAAGGDRYAVFDADDARSTRSSCCSSRPTCGARSSGRVPAPLPADRLARRSPRRRLRGAGALAASRRGAARPGGVPRRSPRTPA